MKRRTQLSIGAIFTLLTTAVGAYVLVTARGFPEPWQYHDWSNFWPLVILTGVYLLAFLTATQVLMRFLYKWNWSAKSYFVQICFSMAVILIFMGVLYLFTEFVFGLGSISLQSSGYIELEYWVFFAYFCTVAGITMYFPVTNPWLRPVYSSPPTTEEESATVVLQHKQETLVLPLEAIPVFVFMRKLCLAICKEGREVSSQKINSEKFKKMPGAEDYIRINRNTFVRLDVIEGFLTRGRAKYVVFNPDMQAKVDRLIREAEPYAKGKNEKDNLREDTFKITEIYQPRLLEALEKRKEHIS